MKALDAERTTHQALARIHSTESGELDAAPASHTLFVTPSRRGDGFRASIRGHLLELADPTDDRLAPTPEELLVVAIASDLAWAARRFLRIHTLTGDVNVSAAWRTVGNPPRLAGISVTLTMSKSVETMSDALLAALEERMTAGSLDDRLSFHLEYQG